MIFLKSPRTVEPPVEAKFILQIPDIGYKLGIIKSAQGIFSKSTDQLDDLCIVIQRLSCAPTKNLKLERPSYKMIVIECLRIIDLKEKIQDS